MRPGRSTPKEGPKFPPAKKLSKTRASLEVLEKIEVPLACLGRNKLPLPTSPQCSPVLTELTPLQVYVKMQENLF